MTNVCFGSKADMCSARADVRFVPIADIAIRSVGAVASSDGGMVRLSAFAVFRLITSSTSVSDRVAIFSRCYFLILSSIDPAAPEGSSLYSILRRVLGLRRPSQRSGHECLQDSVWHGFRVKDPGQQIPRAAPRPRFYFLFTPWARTYSMPRLPIANASPCTDALRYHSFALTKSILVPRPFS